MLRTSLPSSRATYLSKSWSRYVMLIYTKVDLNFSLGWECVDQNGQNLNDRMRMYLSIGISLNKRELRILTLYSWERDFFEARSLVFWRAYIKLRRNNMTNNWRFWRWKCLMSNKYAETAEHRRLWASPATARSMDWHTWSPRSFDSIL